MCKIMLMNTITVSIGAGRADLCKLIEKVEAGARVRVTEVRGLSLKVEPAPGVKES